LIRLGWKRMVNNGITWDFMERQQQLWEMMEKTRRMSLLSLFIPKIGILIYHSLLNSKAS